ncbi:MAG: hypothetical protein K2X77_09685 [Candidatus Obscuribacterales bacterium]|jgi:Flp pilus assembly protein TadG|nr:hypothetical protein [Candidatus Obscuribacterales bacterium]
MRKLRADRGNSIVELPFVIWTVLLILFYPMVNYATVAIRSGFVFNAAQTAALTASKARSYSTSTTADPSAQELATSTAHAALDSCSGIRINSVETEIVITKISDKTKSTTKTKLTSPPNLAENTYQLQVTVDTSVDPLIKIDSDTFGDIPGISSAYNLKVTQRHYVENSQGLMR